MTKNQKVKYFDNTDQEKKNRTSEKRINEFLSITFNQSNWNCNV